MKQIPEKPARLASEFIFTSSRHGPCCQASERLQPGALCVQLKMPESPTWQQQPIPKTGFASGLISEIHLSRLLLPLLCLHHLQSLRSCSASTDLVHKSLCRHTIIKIKWKYREREAVPLNGVGCGGRSRQPSYMQKVWGHFHSNWRYEILKSQQAQEIPLSSHPNGLSFWASTLASCTEKL